MIVNNCIWFLDVIYALMQVTRLTLANGDVVDAERGCIPDSDCYNGCSGFLDESPECTSCCIEDRCNSGVPIFEDVSCYECYNIHLITGGDGPSACDYPFNPHDVSVGTTTCYSGHCAVCYLQCVTSSYEFVCEPTCESVYWFAVTPCVYLLVVVIVRRREKHNLKFKWLGQGWLSAGFLCNIDWSAVSREFHKACDKNKALYSMSWQ